MAPLIVPPGVLSDGMVKVAFVTALADYRAAPSIAEIVSAAGALASSRVG